MTPDTPGRTPDPASLEDIFGPPIYEITRAQLIADGELVEAPMLLRKQAGFRVPVALSRAVWEGNVLVPPGVVGQDETGRLWDILWMLWNGIRSGKVSADNPLFTVLVRNDNRDAVPVQLKAVSGPGDEGEHVITILLPDED